MGKLFERPNFTFLLDLFCLENHLLIKFINLYFLFFFFYILFQLNIIQHLLDATPPHYGGDERPEVCKDE